jgi:hypothetical protein
VAAIAQGARGEDAAVKRGGVLFYYLEMNDSIIDEEFLSWLEVVNEVGIVDGDGRERGFGVDGEDERIADCELARLANGSSPDSRTLGIEKEGDFLTPICG